MDLNILGTEYKLIIEPHDSSDLLGQKRDGYCAFYEKKIIIADLDNDPDWKDDSAPVRKNLRDRILRHEIIHAFIFESGLSTNTACFEGGWAVFEEMIDWIALQYPKMLKVFQECDCI